MYSEYASGLSMVIATLVFEMLLLTGPVGKIAVDGIDTFLMCVIWLYSPSQISPKNTRTLTQYSSAVLQSRCPPKFGERATIWSQKDAAALRSYRQVLPDALHTSAFKSALLHKFRKPLFQKVIFSPLNGILSPLYREIYAKAVTPASGIYDDFLYFLKIILIVPALLFRFKLANFQDLVYSMKVVY